MPPKKDSAAAATKKPVLDAAAKAAKKEAAAAKKAEKAAAAELPAPAPKKEKKEKKETISNEEAVEKIYEYLQVQNRPYSVTDIFANLHGAINKSHVTKVLKELVERGTVVECTSGKQSVYHIVQDAASAYSEEELASLRSENASMNAEITSLRQQKRELDHKLSKLRAAPPIEELQAKVEALKDEIGHREEILESLRASASELTDEQKEAAAAIEKERDAAKALYYRRKKSFKFLMDIICESGEIDPMKLTEELGLEEYPV